ncbi:MAG: amidase [Deltaproteobacteria bacterium]|nr:MAG: amidase [Deltaproteobacteria bacterium]
MRFPEYDQLDATALAELVKKGEVSPSELLEAAIERAEARNPKLNAIVTPLFERARQHAENLPGGPFKGVPFLLKDLKAALAGTTTSNSCKLQKNETPTENSHIVDRYLEAGLQIMGKTNTPEFGIMGITEPELRGPCRNPWSLDHTPGGSSGGSSSAVAARIVPVAHGGDGGGSIRIPASACGLFGLKPTRGRVSQAPFRGESWGGFVQEHVLARTVRDSAAFLDLVDTPPPGEPYHAPHKQRPWADEVGADPGKLRIAFDRDTLFAGTPHEDCKAAVDEAVSLLTDLGHHVEEARPSFHREELVRAYFITVASGVANFVENAAAKAGKKPSSGDFEPRTWVLAQIGWAASAAELSQARADIQRNAREVAQFFETYDLYVNATHGAPPTRVGELDLTAGQRFQLGVLRAMPLRSLFDKALDSMGTDALARTPNTQLFNQTGQPAMSVPLYWNKDGLPIGTQIAARFGDEATLFRVAAQLEEARPWANKPGWDKHF